VAKKKSLLAHGFKAYAEREAIRFRSELGLEKHAPLSGFNLAEHLNIKVYVPEDIFPSGTDLSALLGNSTKNNGWSALTMDNCEGRKIIIHNNLHAPARIQSDLMHELAHAICKHKYPVREGVNLPFFMREHNPQHEEEANYLGSTLQITRKGLLWGLKEGMTIDELCEYFTASKQMVNFRINSTGVKKQLSYMTK